MSAPGTPQRGTPTVGDTLPEAAATPLPDNAEVAPGVVLDPETRQPMEVPGGAATPPTAPAEMLDLPDTDSTALAPPDDLQHPPS
jgi:hypothetical protein